MAYRSSSCSLRMCIMCSKKLGIRRDIVICRCSWTRARIACFSRAIRAASWDGCLPVSYSLWTDNGHLCFVFALTIFLPPCMTYIFFLPFYATLIILIFSPSHPPFPSSFSATHGYRLYLLLDSYRSL